MRNELLALFGSGCLLTGCQAPLAQAQTSLPSRPVIAKAPDDPGAGTTLCAPDDGVLISCRLQDSAQIASICVASVEDGEPRKVRFVQGVPGATPVLQHVADGSDSVQMFRRTHLFRAGPTGGHVYTFEHGGFRYGFYTEEGTYHALAGLFHAQPASPKVIRHQLCDMETVVISYDRGLMDLTRTWPKDPLIEEYDVPLVDDKGGR